MPCFEKLTCCECVNVCVQVRLRLTFFFCYECLGIFEYFIFFLPKFGVNDYEP